MTTLHDTASPVGTTPAGARPCPACSGLKAARQYLCRGCWFTLQSAARRALNKHDGLAARRLSELLEQLRNDMPLHLIVVTP
jgi:hypothetical protein